jgi:hypothetical protein
MKYKYASLFTRHNLLPLLIGSLLFFSSLNQPAHAGEGGGSNYTPGTYGDFSMNYATPGLYITENVIFATGKLDKFPNALALDVNLQQTTWFNLFGVSYIAPQKLLGANYFITANIPYGFSSKLELDMPGVGTAEDRASGLGDIWVAPLGLMWNLGNFHITLIQAFVLPAGRYDKTNLVNMGRNYVSYETDIGFTWLDEKRGHEVSFIAGYMINSKNKDTDYKTGDEFHFDFAVNQYFSENFGIGIVGYYYQQITDDSSPDLDLINQTYSSFGLGTPDGYKGRSAGVGPAIMIGLTKDIKIVAKWIHEYHAENRFSGDWAFISLSMKF